MIDIPAIQTIDFYHFYRKENKKTLGKSRIGIKRFRKIISEYNKFFVNNVLEGESEGLPMNFGTIAITGKQQKPKIDNKGNVKGLNVDWGATQRSWKANPKLKESFKKIYHLNEHTAGVKYRIAWSRLNVLKEDKFLFKLDIARSFSLSLKDKLFEGKEYINRK